MLCRDWIWYHGWWRGGKEIHNILEVKRNVFDGPLEKKAALQFTKSYQIWVPGGGAFSPSLRMLALQLSTEFRVGRCSGPVWELATSVKELLQMVQLISWQNSWQTSSRSAETSLALNAKPASCSVPWHFLQSKILNHFYWTLDTLEDNQSATLFYAIC